jgi:dihydroorotate dehydrogenase (NAD+) catalytic subunit
MKPRRGNPGNRIVETPSGVLNSIGLENVGLDEFIEKKLPFLVKSRTVTIPNVAAHSVEENVELCSILSKTPGVDAIELNVSCPNVKQGGMAFGTDMRVFTELVEQAREVTSCPLIVKLSPNVTDIASFALRAEEIGVDALSAINTLLGMKINIKNRRPHFANRVAGLSGPAIRPVAVRIVYQICEKVRIPVVGMGGIMSIEDVIEFIMAGASAVSIGTASMIEPAISGKLAGQLEDYMKKEGINSLDEIRGAAHRV